jgi:phage I-like protein
VSNKRSKRELQRLRHEVDRPRAVYELACLKGDDGKRVAPSEFRVFPAGPFSTTKGLFTFTPRSAGEVMAAYRARNLPLMGDYEHQTDAESMGFGPMEAPASITEMTPEVRNDERGQPELWVKDVKWTDRARAYLEAGEYRLFSPVFRHTPEGEVLSLERIALTNKPATDGLVPLVAASSASGASDDDDDDDEENDMSTCTECAAKEAKIGQLTEQLTTLTTQLTTLTAKMGEFEKWAEEEKKEHGMLTAALKEITGKDAQAEQLGVLTAHKAAAEECATLKATAESEKVARLTGEYNAKAEAAIKSGKLPPAVKAKCDEIAKKDGIEQALSFLSAFADASTAPIVTLLSDAHDPAPAPAALDEMDAKIAASLNLSPEAYLKQKQALAARRG